MATTDRAAARSGTGEWDQVQDAAPAEAVSAAIGAQDVPGVQDDVPTAPPPAPYPEPVYGSPPPAPPATDTGVPVGPAAPAPVPASNPYAPPAYGEALDGRRASSEPVYGEPAHSELAPAPRRDPGARNPSVAVAPSAPTSYAEAYGFGGYDYVPEWAGGSARPAGSGRSITAFGLAALSLFFLTPFIGTAAIVFAAFGLRRGERLARAALITSVLFLVGGMALSILSYTAGTPGI